MSDRSSSIDAEAMSLSNILLQISVLIWLFPPLKQFRGRYFFYFLFLAVSDPIALLLVSFKLTNLPLYVVLDLLSLISLWKPELLSKKISYLIIPVMIVYYIAGITHYTFIFCFLILLHIIIIYLIIRIAVADIIEKNRLKYFYFAILLYELTVILKFAFLLANIKTGLIFFYSTTAFETMLALFFILVNENTKLAFRIK